MTTEICTQDNQVMQEVAVVLWICSPPSDLEVMGSIHTVGAFCKSPAKTPTTGSRPRKRTRERFDKLEAFDAIEQKQIGSNLM